MALRVSRQRLISETIDQLAEPIFSSNKIPRQEELDDIDARMIMALKKQFQIMGLQEKKDSLNCANNINDKLITIDVISDIRNVLSQTSNRYVQ